MCIKCHFCEATCESLHNAAVLNWTPSFYDGDDQIDSVVCPECSATYLHIADDGEIEVKP